MLWITGLIGVFLALGFVAFARWGGDPRREARWYAIGLVIVAMIYVGFAAFGMAGDRWVVVEGVGVLVFLAFAVLGWRVAPAFLGAGWLVHVAWDTVVHPVTGNAFVPGWYPALCIGFDLVVAAAALQMAWRLRRV